VVATQSRLRPLRWIAEEALVYDSNVNEMHKPGCSGASRDPASVELAPGEWIESVWAPGYCWECRPDVTTALGL
jgi:hypothetical protein